MARLRKEKGGPSHSVSNSKSKSKSKKLGKEDSNAVLREQVLALGGTQDDIELLKNVDENTAAGSSTQDVHCLS